MSGHGREGAIRKKHSISKLQSTRCSRDGNHGRLGCYPRSQPRDRRILSPGMQDTFVTGSRCQGWKAERCNDDDEMRRKTR